MKLIGRIASQFTVIIEILNRIFQNEMPKRNTVYMPIDDAWCVPVELRDTLCVIFALLFA